MSDFPFNDDPNCPVPADQLGNLLTAIKELICSSGLGHRQYAKWLADQNLAEIDGLKGRLDTVEGMVDADMQAQIGKWVDFLTALDENADGNVINEIQALQQLADAAKTAADTAASLAASADTKAQEAKDSVASLAGVVETNRQAAETAVQDLQSQIDALPTEDTTVTDEHIDARARAMVCSMAKSVKTWADAQATALATFECDYGEFVIPEGDAIVG